MQSHRLIGGALLILWASAAFCTEPPSQPIHVTPEEAQRHLLEHPQADYPRMADIGRIQGAVELELTIDERGKVKATYLIGHPMLQPAAMQAASQWKYQPFERDGRAVPVNTEVTFWIPGKPSAKNREFHFHEIYDRDESFGKHSQARNDYKTAGTQLLLALAVAEDNADTKWNELATVTADLGSLEFAQKNSPQAEEFYRESLAQYEGHGDADDPQAASVMESLATVYASENAGDKAEPLLLQAVETFRKGMAAAATQDAKTWYGSHLAMSSFWLVAIGTSSHRLDFAKAHCADVIEYSQWLPKDRAAYVGKGCGEVMGK